MVRERAARSRSGPVPRLSTITPVIYLLLLIAMVSPAALAQDRPDALVLYRQGRFQQAAEVTLQELQDNPANLDAYTVLGWSLLALGRLDDALEYGQQGLRISRFDVRLIHILGEAHYRSGNYLEALQYLQDYAGLAPEGRQIDQVYYLMGEVFLQFEEYNHADIALTTAVRLNGNRAAWWTRLGFAREMAGDETSAASAYRSALQLDSNQANAREGLARLGLEPTG
jgi:tetratricopeptide (TPR) repeat protein